MSPDSKKQLIKLYNDFYAQEKMKYQIIKNYIEHGNLKSLDLPNYDPTVDLLLLDVGPYKNFINGGEKAFNWSASDGTYYFDLENLNATRISVESWINEIYDVLEKESESGLRSKAIFGVDNLNPMVCGKIETVGQAEFQDRNRVYLSFPKNKYNLSADQKAALDQVALHAELNNAHIYLEGRGAKKEGKTPSSRERLGYNNLSWLRVKTVQNYLNSKSLEIPDDRVIALGSNDPIIHKNKTLPLNRCVTIEFIYEIKELPPPVEEIPKHRDVLSRDWGITLTGIFTLQNLEIGLVMGVLENLTNGTKGLFTIFTYPDFKDEVMREVVKITGFLPLTLDKNDQVSTDFKGASMKKIIDFVKSESKIAQSGLFKFYPNIGIGGEGMLTDDRKDFKTSSPMKYSDFHGANVRFTNIAAVAVFISSGMDIDFYFPTIDTVPKTFEVEMNDFYGAGITNMKGSGMMELSMFSSDQ